ncbi:hypothetical protein EMIHUDRAFT_245989 [Emiliania huxleyi CCMP1516]|uniref:Uncharacterized protein n=2 Tax=Emiliania huxleyi TaxID=2903 RepID=A0A0D3IVA3_EMIH1|nr:hypothetical protein EMIHUDRAFT_245989 [Emiliania huxleyi CCMP1516]EOD15188.1 hypothetical protein EMIHUDRAFT_245989 [Emiliania huxleyi CCMP1516]|eukprot:XP_005767617.1 hypothetical protein EMIHUDRAFT_245989 [Emiliania huxleyi CCMP1516]
MAFRAHVLADFEAEAEGELSGGFVTEVRAMRGTAGLGLDLDNQNIVRRISPGSMAEQQGARAHPLAGVDGQTLRGGVANGGQSVMAPGQPAYRFKIYRPPFDESRQAALSKDFMWEAAS